MFSWQIILGLIMVGLVLWIGVAWQRYQRALIKPEGKARDEWLMRALQIAEAAEQLLNPQLWQNPYGAKLTPELRKQHVADLHRHMLAYLCTEHVSITLNREQVLLLLAQRDLTGNSPCEEEEAQMA